MLTEDEGFEDRWRANVSKPLTIDRYQPLTANIEVEIAAASDCGRIRTHNTDHYLAVRLGRLQETIVTSLAAGDLPLRFEEYGYSMLIADGLGDDEVGTRASRMALSALAYLAIRYGKWNVRISPETASEVKDQGAFLYREANAVLVQASQADLRLATMAASLTAVYIAGTDLFFAHAGHSRAFLFRNGALIQLTTDHRVRETETSESRVVKPQERPRIDQRHVVTESLGGRAGGPNVEIEHVQLWSDDRVLLCTNGLTDVVSEERIADVLAPRRGPKDDCKRLVDLALTAGGPDNVTVLVADYTIRPSHMPTELPAAP
jgi:PPM family protein phosphatase